MLVLAGRVGVLWIAGALVGCARADSPAAQTRGDIALGQKIFMRTQTYSAPLHGKALACTNSLQRHSDRLPAARPPSPPAAPSKAM